MKLSRPQTAGSGPGEPEGGAAAGAMPAWSAWQRGRYRQEAWVQARAAEPIQSAYRAGQAVNTLLTSIYWRPWRPVT